MSHPVRGFCTALLAALVCLPTVSRAAVPEAALAGLQHKASRAGRVRVIVELTFPFQPAGRLSPGEAAAQATDIAEVQRRVADQARRPGTEEIIRFSTIPFSVFSLDMAGLERLALLPEVIGIEEDIPEWPTLASSAPIIGADVAWNEGFTGAGQVIAILDTGVAKTHPYFSAPGKIVSEACYSSATDPETASLCPGGAASSTASGSGINCPTDITGCYHGTHVAGIAAGVDPMGVNIGIARGAGLIPIQVFTRFDSEDECGPSAPCAKTFPSDQILGLERVLELAATHDIAAVNMSLGGGAFTSQASCDSANTARKAAIDNLRSAGIATIIASGNGSLKSAIGQPGCISTAISVGATTDADAVASYSNIASFISLLAPGSDITSSVPGGGTSSVNGTSMATPHVAGAFAVLRQASPGSSITEILSALQATGTPIDDLRSGGVVQDIPRINLDLALDLLTPAGPEFGSVPAAGSNLAFGNVVSGVTSPPIVVEVTNSGGLDLELACALNGPDSDQFDVTQCPNSAAPGGSVEVSLTCTPGSVGLKTASLGLTTNDSDEGSASYALTCTGAESPFFTDGFED